MINGTKKRNPGAVASSVIVKDLVKAKKVRHADTPNVWVDALGRERKSKGLYQVVSEGS
jgi:hypothetical protein